jgi:hypothetical protein
MEKPAGRLAFPSIMTKIFMVLVANPITMLTSMRTRSHFEA